MINYDISWEAQGEANQYRIMQHGNWLANVQLNGELTTLQHKVIMNNLVNGLGVGAKR